MPVRLVCPLWSPSAAGAGDRRRRLHGPGTAAKRRVALVITNATVVTLDGTRRVLAPGAVAIDGADIVGVDTPAAIAAAFTASQTIDGTGQIVLPGLINTHTAMRRWCCSGGWATTST